MVVDAPMLVKVVMLDVLLHNWDVLVVSVDAAGLVVLVLVVV